uniref:Putative vacuolar assembly/sorting n=1 Tax=Amblyomma aureolatum TaxID=187763 RepID=A0A1E1XHE1_9ACAR
MSLKAFDLVPLSERVSTGASITEITCLECSGRTLYVGTADGFLIQYDLEDHSWCDGRRTVAARKARQKYIGTKKPVRTLKAMSALERLLCLSDGNFMCLNMVDLDILAPLSKLKGISAFCVNENPTRHDPFCVQVCAAKRKQLQLYAVTDSKVTHQRDISLAEHPLALAMDGDYICVATATQYLVACCSTGHIQNLVPYESELTVPFIKRIAKDEFLLNGPSDLGIFATSSGVSQRPPLPWGASVSAVAYGHPYVVCLSEDYVTVYSIFDQQPKQRVPFVSGTFLDNFEGKLLLAGRDTLFMLQPVPWEAQVQALLADEKVAEALELARHSNKTGLSHEQNKEVLQRIQLQAGFIEFSNLQFAEAEELFQEGGLDVRELISLYPDLLAASSVFKRASPKLHDIDDVVQMCDGDKDKVARCQQFLASYLETSRQLFSESRMEVNSALLKVYALSGDDSKLLGFLQSNGSICCDLADCAQFLKRHGHPHAAALLYHAHREHESCLRLWASILSGELEDKTFPGLQYYVDYLSRLSNHKLLWSFAELALERDQEVGVKIFTDRPSDEPESNELKPENVLEYLHRFTDAVVFYLEHLVFQKKLEKEKYHTLLAVMYLDAVLRYLKENGPSADSAKLKTVRDKLQHLLRASNSYRVQLLLGRALENNLHQECAILYGKLEDHDKALRILVHQLKDYQAAEDYCQQLSQRRDRRFRHRLYHTLLAVYLDSSLPKNDQEALLPAAIQLLNSEVAEFDAVKVLQLLPTDWSVSLMDQFLTKAVRTSLHRCNMARVESALSRAENLQLRWREALLHQNSMTLTEDRTCAVCHRPFQEPSFAWCPNGSIVHIDCMKSMAGSAQGHSSDSLRTSPR